MSLKIENFTDDRFTEGIEVIPRRAA